MSRKRNVNQEEVEGVLPDETMVDNEANEESTDGLAETQKQVQDQFFDGTIDQKYK